MNIKEYIKHRWYMITATIIVGIFTLLVSWSSDLIYNTNFIYVIEGIVLGLIVFGAIDFVKLRSRMKCMKEYLWNNCSGDFKGNYPLDIYYAEQMKKIVDGFSAYREMTDAEHNSELEFITKWVHDVKVPIAAVNLITENMDSKEANQIEMQLNYIDQNIQKILYHMKSKRFYDDYKIKETNLKSIVNQALKSYAVFFSYKSISLTIDCKNYNVYTDEKWSVYIISQFISNAVKYTDFNGEIKISAKEKDGRVSLSVRNTGEGMEQSNIKNIFKRGYASYNTRKEKSTGYGLYLSKKLAEKMGHKLQCQSVLGESAEFTICYDTNFDNTHWVC